MRETFPSRYALLLALSLRDSAEARVREAESARFARGIRARRARRLLAHREAIVAVMESDGDPRIGLAAGERVRRLTRVALLLAVLFLVSLVLVVLAVARSGVTSGWTGVADVAMIVAASGASVVYALVPTKMSRERRSLRDRRTGERDGTFGAWDRRSQTDRRQAASSQW